jgi:hypothetical protein
MATWLELAQDNSAAAHVLLASGRFRSSVSRSYYAAYAGITHLLVGRVAFPAGRNNPTHESIAGHIANSLQGLTPEQRRALKTDFSVLLKARVVADYIPGHSCDDEIARNARLRSDGILKEIGLL